MNTNTPYRGLFLLTALFSLVVLQWNLPNLGGNLNPRSFFSWSVLVLATTLGWLTAISRDQITWHPSFKWLLVPPLAVLIYAALGPPSDYENYPLLAACSLLLGALWVIGLLQFRLTKYQWFLLAWVIFVGCAILSIFTLIGPSYFKIKALYKHLPVELMAMQGGFQQPNNFGSFLAASFAFTLYCLIDSPAADNPKFRWSFAILATVVCTMIWMCGSRTGYLGLLISFFVLGIWLYFNHRQHTGIYIIGALSITIGLCIVIQAPLLDVDSTYWVKNRVNDLTSGEATMARKNMWIVTLSSWSHAPFFGHGLGTFTEVFMPELNRLAEQGIVFAAPDNLTHPHNELVLWLAETGLVGAILVFAPWVALIVRASRINWSGQLGWLATLLPIILHTQTEFPLHGSGAHWLLLGLIVANGPMPLSETKPLHLSRVKQISATGLIASLGLLISLFLMQTACTSHQAFINFYKQSAPTTEFFEKWAQSPEFTHPLLGQNAQDMMAINSIKYILSTDNEELKRMGCQLYESYATRYKSKETQERLKQCP